MQSLSTFENVVGANETRVRIYKGSRSRSANLRSVSTFRSSSKQLCSGGDLIPGQHSYSETLYKYCPRLVSRTPATCAAASLMRSRTHIIMEGFRFTGVVTCLSSLWCGTIQVPKYTVDKTHKS